MRFANREEVLEVKRLANSVVRIFKKNMCVFPQNKNSIEHFLRERTLI